MPYGAYNQDNLGYLFEEALGAKMQPTSPAGDVAGGMPIPMGGQPTPQQPAQQDRAALQLRRAHTDLQEILPIRVVDHSAEYLVLARNGVPPAVASFLRNQDPNRIHTMTYPGDQSWNQHAISPKQESLRL